MRYAVNLMLQLHLFAMSMRSVLLSCTEFCIQKDDAQLALDNHDFVNILIWFREVYEGTVQTPCEQIRPIWARISSSLPSGIERLKGDCCLDLVVEYGMQLDQHYRHAEQVASMFMRELGPAEEIDNTTFDMLVDVDPVHCNDCGMCLACHAKEVERNVGVAQRSVRRLMRAIAACTKSFHRRQKRGNEGTPGRSLVGVKRGRDSDEWERESESDGGYRSDEGWERREERNVDYDSDRSGGRDRSSDEREGERRVRGRYQ